MRADRSTTLAAGWSFGEGQPIGQVLDDPALVARLKFAMAETIAVARAKGIALPGDIESLTHDQMRQFPPSSKPSMLEDMEAGRPLELEYLSGAIVRYGKALGVPTPAHEAAYRSISSGPASCFTRSKVRNKAQR